MRRIVEIDWIRQLKERIVETDWIGELKREKLQLTELVDSRRK